MRSGHFPRSSLELAELPGVGRYTAAAVASIAFKEPAAVVDGNVQRVLRRWLKHNLSAEQCWQTAGQFLDLRRPGDFNQAMMELGALVCLPSRPLCEKCPVGETCASRGAGDRLRKPPRRKAVLNYLLARRDRSVLLEQRPATSSLMPLMWELPVLPSPRAARPALTLRHSITVTDYKVCVYADRSRSRRRGRWVPLRTVTRLPLTGLARKILSRMELLPSKTGLQRLLT